MDERGARLIGALLEQRYRVDALLARGGMSSVYRGLDTRLDRRVAIKVMDARFADDRTFVDRFEREARSAAKIHHPNVVAVHDQGVDGNIEGDLVYLVMELVDGGTLRDLINERGALDVPLALAIMEPVLAALASAHRAGLVHRDVKPENVLIGHGGEHGTAVKVGDFGLVRAVASAGTTSSSIILGTVAYLSPEQVTTGTATARGDVYSAGIVLYEMLTGVTPYTGDNPLSIAYRHVNDDVPAPSVRLTGLPPALDELVVRATRRDPDTRPQDGAAFLQEMLALRAQLSVPAVPVPVPEPTIQDRTIPVTPVDRARALTPPAADDPEATAVGLNLAEVGQPAAVATSNATIVRHLPAGFQAMGPQGTRAMLRTGLDQAPPPPPAMHPNLGSPSGGFPVPPMPPPPRKPSRAQQGMPPPKRNNNIVLWSVVVALVLALAGTTTWWFTAGRWSTVPNVAGQQATKAQTQLQQADLQADFTHVWDNNVDAGLVIRTEPAAGKDVLRGEKVKLVVSSGPPRVPDVVPGTSVDDAKQAIKDAGLQPGLDDGLNEFSNDVAKGTVVRLDPESGTPLRLNERVDIVLSKGAEPKPVPDLRNKTKDEAFAQLTELGFQPVEGQAQFDQDIEGGRVISTDPQPGTVLDGDNKQVTVVLSNAVTVPDVSQKSQQDAEATLRGLGLDVDVQSLGGGGGPVLAQNPPANSRVQAGTKVTIWTVP
ncbi:Stk1 family PASTA domain-containing Ser/Thr kinase [Actinophytocola sp.]|uniref:Stk1 family PASTA domain-containing Ser/Thr kinase n=1 Tax=Actinophytocola sp. TaxID=1872138 RepID=UPI002ED95EEB